MMRDGEYELRLAQTVDVEMSVIAFLGEYGAHGAAHLARVMEHYLGETTPCDCEGRAP